MCFNCLKATETPGLYLNKKWLYLDIMGPPNKVPKDEEEKKKNIAI